MVVFSAGVCRCLHLSLEPRARSMEEVLSFGEVCLIISHGARSLSTLAW